MKLLGERVSFPYYSSSYREGGVLKKLSLSENLRSTYTVNGISEKLRPQAVVGKKNLHRMITGSISTRSLNKSDFFGPKKHHYFPWRWVNSVFSVVYWVHLYNIEYILRLLWKVIMEYLFYPFRKFQCQNSVHTVYVKFDHRHTKVGRICC